MPRRTSQRNMDSAKKVGGSILAPNPDAIPSQIRSVTAGGGVKSQQEGDLKIVGPAPYDDDPVALAEKETIDYSIKVTTMTLTQNTGDLNNGQVQYSSYCTNVSSDLRSIH